MCGRFAFALPPKGGWEQKQPPFPHTGKPGTFPGFLFPGHECPEYKHSIHMHRYLAVQNMLNEQPVDSNEIVDWLQRSQNGDGGFGFFPGTTSFIENCHAGLAALTLLAAVPVDLVNARAFVIACQTGAGGFRVISAPLPFWNPPGMRLTAPGFWKRCFEKGTTRFYKKADKLIFT